MTFEVTQSKSIALIISVFSGLVGLTGGLLNLASLSYFVSRAEKSLSRRIFIMLNAFDLLLCSALVPSVVLYFCKAPLCGYPQLPFRISYAFFNLGIECTALATCLLGALRYIAIRFPYYQVKNKFIFAASIIFIFQEILREVLRVYFFFFDRDNLALYLKFHNAAMVSVLFLAVVTNSLSSVLLTWELLITSKKPVSGRNNSYNKKSMTRSSRRGTVTILILSASFLVCNFLFGICLFVIIFKRPGQQPTKPTWSTKLLGVLILWSIIPLNSALNPLVYFFRRKDMRTFVRSLPRRMFQCVPGRESSLTGGINKRGTEKSSEGFRIRNIHV